MKSEETSTTFDTYLFSPFSCFSSNRCQSALGVRPYCRMIISYKRRGVTSSFRGFCCAQLIGGHRTAHIRTYIYAASALLPLEQARAEKRSDLHSERLVCNGYSHPSRRIRKRKPGASALADRRFCWPLLR